MEIVTKGVPAAKAALRRLLAAADRAAGDAVDDVLKTTERVGRAQLALGVHPFGTPTGSAPGTPPWRVSGALARSMHVSRARRAGANTWSGEVGPTTRYSRIQELGGVTGRHHRTRLPARPYMRPTVRIVKPTVRRTFITHYQRAVHEALI